MTPYYEDDHCTIYHGDTFNVLPMLAADSVSLVLADPPYFRVIDAEWDDQWGADVSAFLDWIGQAVDLATRPLMDRGTVAVFCSPDMVCGVETVIRSKMAVLNHIVWRKPGPGRLGQMDKSSMRRFFPTSERIILAERCRNPDGDLYRFRDHVNHSVARDVYADVRGILVAQRDSVGLTNREIDAALGRNGMAGHYFGASQWSLPTEEAWRTISALIRERGGDPVSHESLRQEFDSRRQEFDSRRQEFDSRRQEFDSRRREFDSRRRDLELLSDVWTFEPPAASKRIGGHPTEKPINLMRHLVEVLSRNGDTILDPFMGSGTTLRAAKDLGRKAIGIEIEERYCEIAAKRLAQEVLPL